MSDVVDLTRVRECRKIDEVISRGRVPLTRTHPAGDDTDYAARIQRIRESLERINELMRHARNNLEGERK